MTRYKTEWKEDRLQVHGEGEWVKYSDAHAEIEKARKESYQKGDDAAVERLYGRIAEARKEGYVTGRAEGLNCLSPVTAEARKQGAEEVLAKLRLVLAGDRESPGSGEWVKGYDTALDWAIGEIDRLGFIKPPAPPRLPEKLDNPVNQYGPSPVIVALNALIDYLKARDA